MNHNDTVLVIPGGEFQLSLIRNARKRNLRVICADKDKFCPCAAEADVFLNISLDQSQKLLDSVYSFDPQAVITDETDSAIKTTNWIASKLKVPHIGDYCSNLYTDKSLMRKFSKDHGFPVPQYHLCHTTREASKASNEIGYPVIIKPLDSQSSKGVHKINSPVDLDKYFFDSLRHSRTDIVLVEKFLDGIEFTLEGLVTSKGHKTLAISKKSHYKNSPMVARSLTYAPIGINSELDRLIHQHDDWINKTEIPFGLTHAEYIYSDNTYYMVEVAARGGGTRISSDIVPFMTGLDYQGCLISASMGKNLASLSSVSLRSLHKWALLEFFDFPNGVVDSIDGVEDAMEIPGVRHVQLSIKAGETIFYPKNDSLRSGHFIICSESEDELNEARNRLLSTISVTVV